MKSLLILSKKNQLLIVFSIIWIFANTLLSPYISSRWKYLQASSIYSFSQAPKATQIVFKTKLSIIKDQIKDTKIRNFNKDYDYPPTIQKEETVRIPILTYHHIAPLPASSFNQRYFVSPTMFEKQINYLILKNYKTLTPKEFYDQLKSGKNPIQKSVMLTFDDGNLNNYENAFPILKKYNLVGVFYINSNHLKISPLQLREMAQAGMIINSHSANHIDLRTVSSPQVLSNEIEQSKLALEEITGKKVDSFAYPWCVQNRQVTSMVEQSGYFIALACGPSIDHKFEDRYKLQRMPVTNNFEHFKKLLSGIWEYTSEFGE